MLLAPGGSYPLGVAVCEAWRLGCLPGLALNILLEVGANILGSVPD